MSQTQAHSAATPEATSTRLRRTTRQFIQFGLVGGSGTLVNIAVFYVVTKLAALGGIGENDVVLNLLGTQFNVRFYHVFSAIAFVVANTWNYQLNRSWTFHSTGYRSWWRGYLAFLTTGLGAFVVQLSVATLLMNPTSPIALPEHVFDGSTGLRTKVYWAQVISIVVAMPVNFIINKLWAFRKPSAPTQPLKSDSA